MESKGSIIDKVIVISAILGIVIIGLILFQSGLEGTRSVSDRVDLIQADASKYYQVNASEYNDDHVLFFELCDQEDQEDFKKYIHNKLEKHNLEHLYSLDVVKSSEVKNRN